ncbi:MULTISPECIES: GlxA family transcriptional regulator [unclassified Shinella]|uniref:GlxA family transcriptional regulator n=1 Tax=unclassified Shinella TaxID=2643062 RepID=UPI00225CC100|nr:helix-turn-helix domain-containing protein [Shinella sp. YE25]CAI0341202.1 Helix-turn-helix domain-containing protein [Rhizobiaceae bacterium]CAK7260843.1 AraC family transcriptional regulator, transcriptional activator FtrA [Shinella sp. WSC3-e]
MVRRTIGFVLFDQALSLNLNGPAEAFSVANHVLSQLEGRYDLVFLSEAGGLVRTSCGLSVATQSLESLDPNTLDTLVVIGGLNAWAFTADAPLVQWIYKVSTTARRTCSICNGAFLLAAAGLLDGHRAVTHWCEVERLKAKHPNVLVELDPIYLRDGAIWTSAGMTAGIDLALALIEDDHGRRVSLAVAKELVVFLHRPGGQAQFNSALDAQTRLGTTPPAAKLADLPTWIMNNLNADLSVDGLAKVVGMSQRTFARNFSRWHGGTPARLVQELRVEAACRHLENGDSDIKRIADICGFGDEERMRRAFVRRLAIPPSAYRERFGRPIPAHSAEIGLKRATAEASNHPRVVRDLAAQAG